MKVSPNAPCPCGRDAKLKRCCGPYLAGRPASPPKLVRARYTAYVIGKTRFLIDTTHPEGPQARAERAQWRAELVEYCRATRFESLAIGGHEIDEEADRAWVSFTVRMWQGERFVGFAERSMFIREGTRWRYHSGELTAMSP